MPDDTNPQPGAADTPESNEANDIAALPAWAQTLVKELRRENASHRTAKKQAEAAAQAAEDKRLAEQQQWKELAEKRAAALDALKPLQDRYTTLEETFKATLAKRLEALPDWSKSLVPAFDDPVKTMAWLDANQHVFAARKAPGLDGGVQDQSGKQAPQLTAQEVQMAKAMGLTLEVFAKRKAEIAAQRDQST